MRLFGVVVATLVLSGCSPESDDSATTVQIVEGGVTFDASVLPRSGFLAPPDVALESPAFRHGWSDGDVPFQTLRSAHLRSDSSIVAMDSGANRIYVFRPDGTLADSLGGPGRGPGEFLDVFGTVLLPGDTLLVFDQRTNRVTTFAPDGDLARTAPFSADLTFAEPAGVSAAGAVLWRTRSYRPTTDAGQVLAPVMVSSSDHTSADTIAMLHSVSTVKWPGRQMALPPPLTWLTRQAATPGGFVHVAPDSAAMTWFDAATGQPLRRVSWLEDGAPVTDAFWARYTDAQLAVRRARGADEAALEARASQLREQRGLAPDAAPISRDVQSGQDGSIWIQGWDLDPASDSSEYLVVLDGGACLVRVTGENRFTFFDAADGLVLGRESGPFGEHSLVLHEAPGCPTS